MISFLLRMSVALTVFCTGIKIYCMHPRKCCTSEASAGSSYCSPCQERGWRDPSYDTWVKMNLVDRCKPQRELEEKEKEQARLRAEHQQKLAERQPVFDKWREACEAAKAAGQKTPPRPGTE